jgi:phage-related baseplate assembly protein
MAEVLPRWGLPAVEFLETDSETIKSQIISGYEKASGRTLAAGDPVRLYLLSLAAIIIQQRTAVNMAAQQNLLSYSQGEFLDALGAFMNVKRLAASKAVTTIKFTLSQALATVYTIPAGTEVTNGVVTFATDDELNIPKGELSGSVAASCTVAGAFGNGYFAGQVNTVVKPMTFVAKAENTTTTSGGADAETDEDLANRIRLAPNSFSVAGPTKAYVFHTKSVSSAIIDVSVISPTPGEVDVYPLLEEGKLPSQELLNKVNDYLNDETVRPLTDYVKVLSPTAVNFEIEVHYWINREDSVRSEQIKRDVEAAVETYRLWQQGRIGRDILPAKLIQLVVAAGAIRIDNSNMKPADYKALDASQVAQCTKVTVVYEGYKDE